jgi:hypothetical protein
LQAEINQQACSVGRKLNAGAGFLKPLGLFEDDDAKVLLRQRERRRQSTDTGTGNDDSARRRQDEGSAAAKSCSSHCSGRAASGASAGSWR